MAHAEWVIDLGPGAGHDGGEVVFEGTPAELLAAARDADGVGTWPNMWARRQRVDTMRFKNDRSAADHLEA